MSFKHYLPLILFIPLILIQLNIIPLISFSYIAPDLIVILLIYFTLLYGQIYGTVLGFILGFLVDILTGGILGAGMFTKTLTGFITGYFYNENKIHFNTSTLLFVFIIFIISTLDSFIYALITSQLEVSIAFLFFENGLLSGFYTAVFSLPIILLRKNKFIYE
ncbi:MAG: rod shape-determining protein MreD [Ignavibacteriales bacterium]|nr:rod shape-determining protein MreD [Ignavibacteriales bacterium]